MPVTTDATLRRLSTVFHEQTGRLCQVPMACEGLSSLSGLRVMRAVWVNIAGVHVVRSELARLLRQHGAAFQRSSALRLSW